MTSGAKPWDIHPDLTEERLSTIASLLYATRNAEIKNTREPYRVPWGLGCMAYNRCCAAIIDAEKRYDWLRVLDYSNALVFSIGAPPVRFSKGDPDHHSTRVLARRHAELTQLDLLGFSQEQSIAVWRFLIDTDIKGFATKIHFVGFTETDNIVSQWQWRPTDLVVPLRDELRKRRKPTKTLGKPLVKPKSEGGQDDKDRGEDFSA